MRSIGCRDVFKYFREITSENNVSRVLVLSLVNYISEIPERH